MHVGDTFICARCGEEKISTGTTQKYCKACVKEHYKEHNRIRMREKYYEDKERDRQEAEQSQEWTQKLRDANEFARENNQTYGKAFAPMVTVVIPPEFKGD